MSLNKRVSTRTSLKLKLCKIPILWVKLLLDVEWINNPHPLLFLFFLVGLTSSSTHLPIFFLDELWFKKRTNNTMLHRFYTKV